MEVAADSQVCQRNLAGTKDFARSDDGVVLRVAEVVSVTHIRTYFRCEEFSGIRSVFGARIAVEPGEVGKSKRLRVRVGWIGDLWFRFIETWCRSRSLCGREMVSLRSRGAILLELYQLFLDLL
jgi:hypothetical protein